MSDVPNLIVCAANRDPRTGRMLYGLRHWDSIMHITYRGHLGETAPHDWEQGFVDNRYQFLTRTEAWKVAEVAGQIRRRVGGDNAAGGTLYSENLY
jgi:hypothetical protein